jgi:hypothetical protein
MTDMDKNMPNLSPHGVLITGAPSAGTTTLLRHCLAGLTIGQSGTDPVMPLRFQGPAGVQS